MEYINNFILQTCAGLAQIIYIVTIFIIMLFYLFKAEEAYIFDSKLLEFSIIDTVISIIHIATIKILIKQYHVGVPIMVTLIPWVLYLVFIVWKKED